MSPRIYEPPTKTADDWRALMLAWTLFEQVALHGKPALDTFLAAMREGR